jgi:hypothetical protein
VQVRIARELVIRCRSMNKTIAELDQELEQRAHELAPAFLVVPGCGGLTAAKLLGEIGPVDRFRATRSSLVTAALHRSRQAQGRSSATGSTATATANSTPLSTEWPSPKPAITPQRTPISHANKPKGRAAAKRSAPSNAPSPASSPTH